MRKMKKRLAAALILALLAVETVPGAGVSWGAVETENSDSAATASNGSPEKSSSKRKAGSKSTPSEAVASDGNKEYGSLREAFTEAADGATIVLNENLIFKTGDIAEVPDGKYLTLDMNGHSIRVETYASMDNLKFKGRPIVNKGDLTVTGSGTIDSSASKYGGLGAIDNDGTLTIENGTFKGSIMGGGSAIRNKEGAELLIEDGYFEGCSALYNAPGAHAVIQQGTFRTWSNNALRDDKGEGGYWSYCINNHGDLLIEDAEVEGVQGALALAGGTGVINGGSYVTVPYGETDVAFYGVYIAGESGGAQATINGGTFKAASKYAMLVGNSADGGDKENAKVVLNGGTFISGDSSGYVLNIDYGTVSSDPLINGGTFIKKEGITDTVYDNIVKLTKEPSGEPHTSLDTYIIEGHVVAAAADGQEYTVKKSQDVSGVTIDYQGERIQGLPVEGSGDYLIRVDEKEEHVSGGDTIEIKEVWFGKDITLVAEEDDDYAASEEVKLHLAARPGMPENLKTAASEKMKANGSITGVDGSMEYSRGGSNDYQTVTGTSIENLAAGDYRVRVKAGKSSFASLPVTVTIESVKSPQPKPVPVIDYVHEQLVGLPVSGSGSFTIAADGNETVYRDGTVDIKKNWMGTEVFVKANEDENYMESEQAVIAIPARPLAPSGITTVPVSTEGGSDGALRGVSAAMEYALAGTDDYLPINGDTVGGLVSSYYNVRLAAGASDFASKPVQVFIAAGDEKQSAMEAAIAAGNMILEQQKTGHTLKTLTDMKLADRQFQEKMIPAKTQLQAVLDTLNHVFGSEADVDAYLSSHTIFEPEILNLRKLLAAACAVRAEIVIPEIAAGADNTEVPPVSTGLSELTEEEKQQLDTQAAEQTAQITGTVKQAIIDNANVKQKPEGLEQALSGSITDILSELDEAGDADEVTINVSMKVVYEGMTVAANVTSQTTDEGITHSVQVIPEKLIFTVHPVLSAVADGKTVANDWAIDNSKLSGEEIGFRLPVPDSINSHYAKVRHIRSNGVSEYSYYEIRSRGSNAYIDVAAKDFSTFEVEFTDTLPEAPRCSSADRSGRTSVGSWKLDSVGWRYEYANGSGPKSRWLELPWNGVTNWYYFGADGYMMTGWYQEGNNRYYLHPLADGTRGYMYTGWHQIGEQWFYFNPKSGGPKGSLVTDRVTPDGYTVGPDGARK